MKEQSFEIFLNALLSATEKIEEKYFHLPVTYRAYIYRERAYCYELYHQIRKLLPIDFQYVLSGEINKAGHPLIVGSCGSITPDFLVHNPGHMGGDDNLAIIEVKTIIGADFTTEGEGLLKDIETIQCMTSIKNGYYKGIIVIFGSENNEKKTQIERIYKERCDTEKVILIIHDNPLERARLFLSQ